MILYDWRALPSQYLFVVILVEFNKYRIWDKQACLYMLLDANWQDLIVQEQPGRTYDHTYIDIIENHIKSIFPYIRFDISGTTWMTWWRTTPIHFLPGRCRHNKLKQPLRYSIAISVRPIFCLLNHFFPATQCSRHLPPPPSPPPPPPPSTPPTKHSPLNPSTWLCDQTNRNQNHLCSKSLTFIFKIMTSLLLTNNQ